MDIIVQIIEYHNTLCDGLDYLIIDPELDFNTSLFKKEKNQQEIINSILETKYKIDSNMQNLIDINYNKELIVRYNYINERDKIKISPLDIYSAHLIRLIGLKMVPMYNLELDIYIDTIYLPDIILEINNLLGKYSNIDIKNYCTICYSKLEILGLGKIQTCKKDECIIKSKIHVLNNNITDNYKKDPVVTEFLIQILIEGTKHPKQEKIFRPLPILPQVDNLGEFKNILNNEINNLEIDLIKESKSDIELYRKITPISYGILLNAISDNYFSMSTIERFSTEILKAKKLNNTISVFEHPGVKFIGFDYSYEIENNFKKEHFLFHGSPLHSWYPIVKNGLKVMSGTEFQANGSAYGYGIYFSDSFSFSLRYSANGNYSVVGIFEINDNIEKYLKTTNIYVIPNDNIILLRYLVIIKKDLKNITNEPNYQEITDYFFKYLGGINKLNDKKIKTIKNKRLNAETRLLNSSQYVKNIEIIDETKHWIIELNDNNGKIKLLVYFNDYPRLPPKITIDIDSDTNKKILLDDSNNLILPELSLTQWNVTLTLSQIIEKIFFCMDNNI